MACVHEQCHQTPGKERKSESGPRPMSACMLVSLLPTWDIKMTRPAGLYVCAVCRIAAGGDGGCCKSYVIWLCYFVCAYIYIYISEIARRLAERRKVTRQGKGSIKRRRETRTLCAEPIDCNGPATAHRASLSSLSPLPLCFAGHRRPSCVALRCFITTATDSAKRTCGFQLS